MATHGRPLRRFGVTPLSRQCQIPSVRALGQDFHLRSNVHATRTAGSARLHCATLRVARPNLAPHDLGQAESPGERTGRQARACSGTPPGSSRRCRTMSHRGTRGKRLRRQQRRRQRARMAPRSSAAAPPGAVRLELTMTPDFESRYAAHMKAASEAMAACGAVLVNAGAVNETTLVSCRWEQDPFTEFVEEIPRSIVENRTRRWRESAWYRGVASDGSPVYRRRFGNLCFCYLPLELTVVAWEAARQSPWYTSGNALGALESMYPVTPEYRARFGENAEVSGKTVESISPEQRFDLPGWQSLAWCVGGAARRGLVKYGILDAEQLQTAEGLARAPHSP